MFSNVVMFLFVQLALDLFQDRLVKWFSRGDGGKGEWGKRTGGSENWRELFFFIFIYTFIFIVQNRATCKLL